MYMKKYYIFSAAILALATSCQSDDFLGNTPGNVETSSDYSAIKFDGNAGKISRVTSNTADTDQGKLDYQFKIYGVKKGTNNKYSKVFGDYSIWYDTKKTTSNTNSWEYVGSGTITTGDNDKPTTITLENSQTIKYWDYASDDYHFVAGSPISAFTYNIKQETGDIESATVSSLGGHITANVKTGTKFADAPTPVYVAKPIVVKSSEYKKPVKFEFVRHQTKVRVGIYETIPGYSISKINFYKYVDGATNLTADNNNNIILTSATEKYFSGGSDISGTISYDWTQTPAVYTFAYKNDATKLTESKNWYGGAFTKGVKAKVSNHTNIEELYGTDADMESNGYFTVLPTPSAIVAKPILIKCDYTLTADDNSGETIEVKGATAAIPEAYSRWDTNTLYTYIFKISDNTNGYTGTDNPDHVGLYPITFDAAVKAPQFGIQGTITTFTTPSITTYQEGSVVDNGGIKYVAGKNITVKVTNSTDGTDLDLTSTENENGYIDVHKFTTPITEAEVQVKSLTNGTEVTGGTVNTSEKSFTFTPDAEGYYVIRYLTKTTTDGITFVNTYKVVHVAAN